MTVFISAGLTAMLILATILYEPIRLLPPSSSPRQRCKVQEDDASALASNLVAATEARSTASGLGFRTQGVSLTACSEALSPTP